MRVCSFLQLWNRNKFFLDALSSYSGLNFISKSSVNELHISKLFYNQAQWSFDSVQEISDRSLLRMKDNYSLENVLVISSINSWCYSEDKVTIRFYRS